MGSAQAQIKGVFCISAVNPYDSWGLRSFEERLEKFLLRLGSQRLLVKA